MPWSTKQLADLAAVSLRTIRHYHDVGLLAEPARLSNGYKQYEIPHLVTVLRIKRMSSLGLTLDQIAEMLDSPLAVEETLRSLHAELTDTITRLERVRAEVSTALESGVAPDITPDTALAMNVLGHDADSRSIAIIMTHLLRPADVAETFGALADSADELSDLSDLDEAFRQLRPDAGADETERLARRMTEVAAGFLAEHPQLLASAQNDEGDDVKTAVVVEAMKAGLNRPQSKILDRVMQDLRHRFDDSAERRT
ncbi:MerR family transcriptional regulator [Okibacterium endophyticum]